MKAKNPKNCQYCHEAAAKLKRAKNGYRTCLACFYHHFEEEVHNTIVTEKLMEPGEHIVLAISGGKDSTVLIEVMTQLKKRHDYPVSFSLLAIDEGIVGYRDDSLVTVKNNSKHYKLPLIILGYKELFGRTMDEVVALTNIRCSCTYCGVFRRRALNIGSVKIKGDRLYTGHNADDMAETIMMNMLRGDAFRLANCTESTSGTKNDMMRCKPFKFTYEKEIVLYAHYKKLEYFSTECTYAEEAFRGHLKELMKMLMSIRPGVIEDIIRNAEGLKLKKNTKVPLKKECKGCGCISSNDYCKVCLFKQGLDELEKKSKSKKVELTIEES